MIWLPDSPATLAFLEVLAAEAERQARAEFQHTNAENEKARSDKRAG